MQKDSRAYEVDVVIMAARDDVSTRIMEVHTQQATVMTFTCQDCQARHLLMGAMKTPDPHAGIVRGRCNDQRIYWRCD